MTRRSPASRCGLVMPVARLLRDHGVGAPRRLWLSADGWLRLAIFAAALPLAWMAPGFFFIAGLFVGAEALLAPADDVDEAAAQVRFAVGVVALAVLGEACPALIAFTERSFFLWGGLA